MLSAIYKYNDEKFNTSLLNTPRSTIQETDLIDANLMWSCQTLREVSQLIIKGSLTLQPGCEVEMTGGDVEGSITVLTGGDFTLLSKLEVTVLDKGEPVVGAVVSVDGARYCAGAGRATCAIVIAVC